MPAPDDTASLDALRAARRRVVVTGIGVLSGACLGVEPFWQRLTDPTVQPTHRGMQGFEPRDFFDRRLRRHTDTFAQLGAAAAQLARTDAGLTASDPDRTGVVMGTGNGSGASLIREYSHYHEEGPSAVDPLLGVMTMTNAAASVIALQQEARGVTHAISSGCASGTHAVGEGARLVQYGFCDVVYAGGAEAFYPGGGLSEYSKAILASLENLRVTTTEDIARPFDVDRKGFIAADGAACLILESEAHARSRGARIYAEIVGYGNTNDAWDLVKAEPGGAGIRRCMELALDDAAMKPGEIGFVNTHGTGTVPNDVAESEAIATLLVDASPAVNSIKGSVGHSGPAAGAVEIASVVLAVHHGLIPHTAGLQQQDPALEVDVVQGRPRPWEPAPSMALSLGLGGHNGCVIVAPLVR